MNGDDGMMEIIDLTHLMENKMPAYPGEKSPVFTEKLSHKKDGVQVLECSMLTHTGTHLDTPKHFFAEGQTTDLNAIDRFAGKGVLVDCSDFGQGDVIGADHLENFSNDLLEGDYALIYTGWEKYWGRRLYYGEFPVISEEAAEYLARLKLKGIGLDVPSVDPVASSNFPNHYTLLGKGLIIIENLTNLNLLKGLNFLFAAFPLKIKNGDGSPVRAVAIITRK